MEAPEPRQRLDSWKEIAHYLGRTVRTIQRWETEEGLPLHRHQHQSRGNVYAFADELDAWIARHQAPQQQEAGPETGEALPATHSRRQRLFVLTAILAVVAVAASLIAWTIQPRPPIPLLVTALDNRTGDSVLEDAIPFLLERGINGLPGVYVVSRPRIEDTLRLMRKEPNAKVDEDLARAICLRDGGIRLIVNIRAERLGSAYLLTARLIDAATGQITGGTAAEVRSLEEIPRAVQKMSVPVRRLADHGTRSPETSPRLEAVTTPSLRACQLFSRAYREAQFGNMANGEQLARAALIEDPQFAMAHIWLFWMLANQNKSRSELLDHLRQAVALSGSATARERQFIVASEVETHGDAEQITAAWRQMVLSYPDDYWALNNYSIHAPRRAGREWFQLAEQRPNDPATCYWAASEALSMREYALERKFEDRLTRLLAASPDTSNTRRLAHSAALLRLHQFLLGGQLDRLRTALDQMPVPTDALVNEFDYHSAAPLYEATGLLRRWESMVMRHPQGSRRAGFLTELAYLRDDRSAFHEVRQQLAEHRTWSILMLMEPDWSAARIRAMSYPAGFDLADSRLAALQGDAEGAARIFERNRMPVDRPIVALAICRAYERTGDTASALRFLQKHRSEISQDDADSGDDGYPYLQRVRYEEARYLRKLGRTREAEQIEAGLRSDLRFADTDHPILVRLRQDDRKPFDIY